MKKKLLFLLPLLLTSLFGCKPSSTIPTNLYINFEDAQETNTSSANFEENFLPNFIYNGVQYVSSLTYSGYSQVNHVDQVISGITIREKALMLGNASGKGELNFIFKKKLVSITLFMRAHVKIYSGGISADSNSTLHINEESIKLPIPTIEDTSKTNMTYQINSKNLTLSTEDIEKGRVWIFSMNLSFEG